MPVVIAKKITTPTARPVARRTGGVAHGLVHPAKDNALTGCLRCPLFCMCGERFKPHAANYERNADSILAALKEPHEIKNHNISERPWKRVDVLFIGEAPGAQEDRDGKPFVGRSGRLLRSAVEQLGEGLRVAFTNVTRCRPPMNKLSPMMARCCAPELYREMNERQPKVVVPLGNVPLAAVTEGHTGILAVCGSVMRCPTPQFKGLIVVPCVHPAYVLRADHELPRFTEAIETACDVARGDRDVTQRGGEYVTLETADDVETILTEYREARLLTAVDVETGRLLSAVPNGHPHLLCLSFSNCEGEGVVVPWDHADSPFRIGGPREKERPRVRKALVDFLTDVRVPKTGQNLRFDRQHIYHEFKCGLDGVVADTMTTHMQIDDRRGTHGLDQLTINFGDMGPYYRELEAYKKKHPDADPAKGGSYAKVSGELLFNYAGMDADGTLRVINKLRSLDAYKNDVRIQRLAEGFFPALSETLADMEYAGVRVNPDTFRSMEKKCKHDMEDATEGIGKLREVRRFVSEKQETNPKFEFNPGSDAQLRAILFGQYKLPPQELTDGGLLIMAHRHARLAKKNPKLQFGDVVRDAIEKGQWSHFSVKADVMEEYGRRENPLAPLALKFRDTRKMLTTYVTPSLERLDPDDRIHGSFHETGAVTGRLSSSDPNLQNLPMEARYAYISRFDHGWILQADYSQIELRVAASFFNERRMIAAYLADEDLHMMTALAISGLPEAKFKALSKDDQKKWRTRAKRINFGIVYGIGATGIQVTLRKEGVFVTVEECEEMLEKFRRAYPDLMDGIETLRSQVRRDGFYQAFTGFTRRVPEVFSGNEEIVARALRQIVNFPIQHIAGYMTLMAMVLIHRTLKAEGFKSKTVVTVHDSIVWDVVDDERLEVARLAKEIMENLPDISDEIIPGLDWSWLKVPIKAEFEVGRSWGASVGFDPGRVDGAGSEKKLWWTEPDKHGVQEFRCREPLSLAELTTAGDACHNHWKKKMAA